jgi:hypothetical protein
MAIMRQFKPGQLQSGSLYPITASFALTASYLSGSISIDTGSLVTTASFNAFTASYTTGSFTGSFTGDGSQLTGIVSSKWTGSNPISRQSDVEITGSLRVQGSITGSLFGTASNATTASYFNETDPIFVAKSGSFATTGSNTFIGTQTITGSNGKLIYTGTTPGYPYTLAEIHTNDDFPWLHRFYNDTFSTSSAVMAYFGHNDGRFVFHNESTQSIGLQVNGYSAENGLLVYSDKVAFVNNVEVTGSLNVVGIITGSLFGTASWATNAITASYIVTAQTASYVLQAVSASFATSASRSISSSFSSTASFVQTAQTASYILNAVSASFATSASRAVSSSFTSTASFVTPLTQDVIITGSLNVTGSSVVLSTEDFRVYDPVSVNNLLEITSLSGVQIASTDGQISTDFEARTNRDSLNIDSIDWENRHLIQSDGTTVTLDWETGAFSGSLQGTASYSQTASYVNTLRQQVLVSGSFKLDPTQDPDPSGLDLDSTVFFQSSSNTALGYDLYVRQNGNLVKWKWIEGILETGLLYGGVVTYSGSNVFVSPGSGIIADHNAATGSEVSPMIEYVTWNAITQSITNIASQQVTYLYIDNNGALQQQSTTFTSQQYHDYIPLGAAGHFDYTRVSAFGGAVQTAYDQVSQMSNFVDAFGPLKVSGYGITGQPGSLRLSVGSGISFIHGGFYENDPEFPSQITTPSVPTASFAYLYRSGSGVRFDTNGGNFYTSLRPQFYDPGTGVTGSVSNNDWTIQRLYSDPNTGILYAYYGQTIYPDYLTAVAELSTDLFTEGYTFAFTTFIGFLIVKSNTSDITDTIDNKIVPAGLFRGSGQGSGGGIAISNLDDLTDVSITSPTNGQALVYDAGIWKNGTVTPPTYIRRSDYTTTGDPNVNYLYCGNAVTGTVESTTAWDISRLAISSSGATLTQTTSSAAWTNRYSYTYS